MDYDGINKQYRSAEVRRYQDLDFVLGYEIRISNNPDKKCEVCKQLAGQYPKTFIWSGWHDKCKCFVTPILQDYEEFRSSRRDRFKAALNGTEHEKEEPKDLIKYLPKQFNVWYVQNIKDMIRGKEFPDFILNNQELIKQSYYYYKTQKP